MFGLRERGHGIFTQVHPVERLRWDSVPCGCSSEATEIDEGDGDNEEACRRGSLFASAMISTGLTFDKDQELLESGNGDAGS